MNLFHYDRKTEMNSCFRNYGVLLWLTYACASVHSMQLTSLEHSPISVTVKSGEGVKLYCATDDVHTQVSWERFDINKRHVQLFSGSHQVWLEPRYRLFNGADLLISDASPDEDQGFFRCYISGQSYQDGTVVIYELIVISDSDNALKDELEAPVVPKLDLEQRFVNVRKISVDGAALPFSSVASPPVSTRIPQREYHIQPWIQRVPIGFGSNASFECVHPEEGRIDIGYTWTRVDDQPLPPHCQSQGRFLIFGEIASASAGKYLCTILTRYELRNMECELIVEENRTHSEMHDGLSIPRDDRVEKHHVEPENALDSDGHEYDDSSHASHPSRFLQVYPAAREVHFAGNITSHTSEKSLEVTLSPPTGNSRPAVNIAKQGPHEQLYYRLPVIVTSGVMLISFMLALFLLTIMHIWQKKPKLAKPATIDCTPADACARPDKTTTLPVFKSVEPPLPPRYSIKETNLCILPESNIYHTIDDGHETAVPGKRDISLAVI
ncbi:uncharacterized protein LOC129596838 isoform X2 [Paramacrobiotus metropolitanus]|uniref:uncharacterized protein LOC129596838 isoform X2 n=1 Tax=Paramacrobiotus metropolitanus TaxID=2943436 RepID=UPI002445F5F4|nr:uncharacterized protein LOC129596838 isoform X2 [Paramacrobiotus metropolitanus]